MQKSIIEIMKLLLKYNENLELFGSVSSDGTFLYSRMGKIVKSQKNLNPIADHPLKYNLHLIINDKIYNPIFLKSDNFLLLSFYNHFRLIKFKIY